MLEESYTYDIQTNRKCSTIPPHVRLVCQKARLLIRPCLVSRKGQRQRTAGVTWSPPLGQWKKKNIQQHMICVSEDVYIGCTFYTLDKDKVHKIVCRFLAKLIKTSRSTEDIRKGNSWSPDRDFIKMANCRGHLENVRGSSSIPCGLRVSPLEISFFGHKSPANATLHMLQSDRWATALCMKQTLCSSCEDFWTSPLLLVQIMRPKRTHNRPRHSRLGTPARTP